MSGITTTTTTSQPPVTTVTTRAQASEFQDNQNGSVLLVLPTDAVLTILSHMGSNTLATFSLSCRYVNSLSRDEFLWEHLFHAHFPFEDSVIPSNVSTLETYKKAHIDQRIHQNLKTQVYASQLLTGHGHQVTSLAIDGNKLYSSSFNQTIRVWDLQTKECVDSLPVPAYTVYSLAFKENKFYAGTREGEILVLDLETHDCSVFETTKSPVVEIAVGINRLYIKSSDNVIRTLDMENQGCLGEFQRRRIGDDSLAIHGDQFYVSSNFGKIEIYDLESEGEKLHEVLENSTILHSLCSIEGNKFYGCTHFHSRVMVNVLDVSTKAFSSILIARETSTSSAKIAGGKLAIGYVDGMIEILDFSAPDKVIFGQIADLFRSENPQDVREAQERFSRMVTVAKDLIYGELDLILRTSFGYYFGCGEHAFLDLYGRSATPAQKAQAIENYLNNFY